MQRLFLIGYMGTGKTTLGRMLAERLGLHFIDMDRMIEQRYHLCVSDIFATKGEPFFRSAERAILEELTDYENVVISTGGGTPCYADNMQLMVASGLVIYISATVDTLFHRLKKAAYSRPLLRDKSDQELLGYIADNLAIREPFYTRAQLVIESGGSGKLQLVDQMVESIQKFNKKTPQSV